METKIEIITTPATTTTTTTDAPKKREREDTETTTTAKKLKEIGEVNFLKRERSTENKKEVDNGQKKTKQQKPDTGIKRYRGGKELYLVEEEEFQSEEVQPFIEVYNTPTVLRVPNPKKKTKKTHFEVSEDPYEHLMCIVSLCHQIEKRLLEDPTDMLPELFTFDGNSQMIREIEKLLNHITVASKEYLVYDTLGKLRSSKNIFDWYLRYLCRESKVGVTGAPSSNKEEEKDTEPIIISLHNPLHIRKHAFGWCEQLLEVTWKLIKESGHKMTCRSSFSREKYQDIMNVNFGALRQQESN